MYKCVHCAQIYSDGAKEVLEGCGRCQSKFFFYIKNEKFKEIMANQPPEMELSTPEKKQMEADVRDIVGIENEEIPVFLDFESVKIIRPGKYLIDLQKLFDKDKPRVYKIEDGKYIVDLMPLTKMKPREDK